MSQIQQTFSTPCGAVFNTKAEAVEFMRRPKILAALTAVTGNNKELAAFLLENQESVENAFETGTIKRVTKAEAKKLEKALEALKALENVPKDLAFLRDNATAVKESFRWPSVKRMSEEEKAVAARNTLLAATDNDVEIVDWILAQKDAILAAYTAGVEKRQVSPKAAEGLAAYRAEQARLKAEKEAAEAAAAQ